MKTSGLFFATLMVVTFTLFSFSSFSQTDSVPKEWIKTKLYVNSNGQKIAEIYYHEKTLIKGSKVTLQIRYELTDYGRSHHQLMHFPAYNAAGIENMVVDTRRNRYRASRMMYKFSESRTFVQIRTPDTGKWIKARRGSIDFLIVNLARELAGKKPKG